MAVDKISSMSETTSLKEKWRTGGRGNLRKTRVSQSTTGPPMRSARERDVFEAGGGKKTS